MGRWQTSSVVVDGRKRDFSVYTPTGFSSFRRYPCIVSLHGGGVDRGVHATMIRREALADASRCLLCLPDGTSATTSVATRTWNAGSCCGQAVEAGVADVAFIERLTTVLQQSFRADARRLYCEGFSNGAMMTYRMAAERPGLFAAVAGVGATMDLSLRSPTQPTPICHVHGVRDPLSRWGGGPNNQGVYLYPVDDHIRYWLRVWGGNEVVQPTRLLKDSDGALLGSVVAYAFGNELQTKVQVVVVNDGGHTWPGGYDPFNGSLGPLVASVDASGILWSFFQQFSLA